jgi:hypothetical protein
VPNRRILASVLAAVLAGCGPWVIEQPVPTPIASVEAPVAPQLALLAERFEIDPERFLAMDDGFVFVIESGDELQLLLSRPGNPDAVDVLARTEVEPLASNVSRVSMFTVVCPAADLNVRYYLFGQDTNTLPKVMQGLDAVGGAVVDGLWVMAVLEDEIHPDQRWSILDAAGRPSSGGTGAIFGTDATGTTSDSTLCEIPH